MARELDLDYSTLLAHQRKMQAVPLLVEAENEAEATGVLCGRYTFSGDNAYSIIADILRRKLKKGNLDFCARLLTYLYRDHPGGLDDGWMNVCEQQRKIAEKIGVAPRSMVRAMSDLVKFELIERDRPNASWPYFVRVNLVTVKATLDATDASRLSVEIDAERSSAKKSKELDELKKALKSENDRADEAEARAAKAERYLIDAYNAANKNSSQYRADYLKLPSSEYDFDYHEKKICPDD